MAAKFVIKQGNTGKYRFNLLATNGQVVATSEAYETRRAALAGVESVRKVAATAVLIDDTAEIAAATRVAAQKTAATTDAKKAPAKKAPAEKAGAKKSAAKKADGKKKSGSKKG